MEDAPATASVTPLDGQWFIATDPTDVGGVQNWFERDVLTGAKPVKVPGIIQEEFPGYHGIAWCRRDFEAPANFHAWGRHLLRFRAVDYLADVWLNGKHVGGHEGPEGMFILNILSIRETLGHHPVAERLLRNMLNYGTGHSDKPLADLPADFDDQLTAIGYERETPYESRRSRPLHNGVSYRYQDERPS